MSKYGCSAGNAINNIIKHGSRREVLKSIQDRNFDVAATDSLRNTVVHSIIKNTKLKEKETIEFLKLFLKHGVSPDAENLKGETALHLAVANRKKDIIDLLIKHNAEVNKRCKNGNTVAHCFIEDEYKKFVQELGSANKTMDGYIIWDSKKMEDVSASFVEWLVSKGFDFNTENKNGESAVYLAVNYNLQYILPVLLVYTNNINWVNSRGETLLERFLTSYHGHAIFDELFYNRYESKILKILLDKGVSVEVTYRSNKSALQIAILCEKSMDIVHMLVYHFPKNQDKSHLATIRLHQMLNICKFWSEERTKVYLEILSDLISKGADVNYKKELCDTPLYRAVKAENLNIIKFLRDNGTNFRVREKDLGNILHKVIHDSTSVTIEDIDSGLSQIFETFEFLLNEGCDVNARNETYTTPLHAAARIKDVSAKKHEKSGESLAYENPYKDTSDEDWSYGPSSPCACDWYNDIDDRETFWDRHCNTSINDSEMDACANRMLVALLKQGAHVNALDEDGDSVLYYAIRTNSTANVKELLEWGADINENCVLRSLPLYDSFAIMSLLLNHWIKLKAANLHYAEKYNDYVNKYEYQKYYEECLKEIEKLKSNAIVNSVSVYDFLHRDPDRRYFYVNNETLLGIINSPSFEQTYPKYSVIILAKYREAVTRRRLLESAKLAWIEFTKIYLPEICIEQILSYLSSNDLVTIIENGDNTVARVDRDLSLDPPGARKYKFSSI